MKYTTFFFLFMMFLGIKTPQAVSLYTYTMDDWMSDITVRDPRWGSSSSGRLKAFSSFNYKSNMNTTKILSASDGFGLFAAIRVLDLRPRYQDSLTLFDARYPKRRAVFTNPYYGKNRKFDSSEILSTFYAPSGKMGVTFTTGPDYSTSGYDGFELIFTAQANSSKCQYGDFRCSNKRCIASILTCDGHNHCGDRSDQYDNCDIMIVPKSQTAVIAGTSIFLLIAAICVVCIIIRRTYFRRGSVTETVISHPPPPSNLPSYPNYPQPGTYYPPPPPPYSPSNQGIVNQGYH